MAVNELLVQAAVALGLEDGKKLRVDTTVVQTDVHQRLPSDQDRCRGNGAGRSGRGKRGSG